MKQSGDLELGASTFLWLPGLAGMFSVCPFGTGLKTQDGTMEPRGSKDGNAASGQ